MLKTLATLGFTETDAQVYVFLLSEGPQDAKDIAEVLEIQKQKLQRDLEKLQQKGLINASQEQPTEYSAISFEKILDHLIKIHLRQAEQIEKEKNELLNKWHSGINKNSTS
jgi:sugar-specific transcriptional regulator TrmB